MALLSKRRNTHRLTSLVVSSAGHTCRGLKVLLAAPFFIAFVKITTIKDG
jgi:hypothetical protein